MVGLTLRVLPGRVVRRRCLGEFLSSTSTVQYSGIEGRCKLPSRVNRIKEKKEDLTLVQALCSLPPISRSSKVVKSVGRDHEMSLSLAVLGNRSASKGYA